MAVGCCKARADLSVPSSRCGSSLSSGRHFYTSLASNMTLVVAPISLCAWGARLQVHYRGVSESSLV